MQHQEKDGFMKKGNKQDMPAEYDPKKLGKPVRGKHYEKYRKQSHLVLLSPDVAAEFPTDLSVNQALRAILRQREKTKSGR